MGQPSELGRSGGRVYSVEDHPYVYFGRLVKGDSTCDESAGFTFANVKSLGLIDSECKYQVLHDEAEQMMLWAATCDFMSSTGVPAVSMKALAISDRESIGKDGKTPLRAAWYSIQAALAQTGEEIFACVYDGFVGARPSQSQ